MYTKIKFSHFNNENTKTSAECQWSPLKQVQNYIQRSFPKTLRKVQRVTKNHHDVMEGTSLSLHRQSIDTSSFFVFVFLITTEARDSQL